MSDVITFYSYKGGSGRSMAMANVSIQLSKWGYKVLVVDWALESPGLERFYESYLDVGIVKAKPGVIDLLQSHEYLKWEDCVINIFLPFSDSQIHFICSGKRDKRYFKKIRDFDVESFYALDGGDVIENLRNCWLEAYDFILIDSCSGITEIGAICTIQLPDTVALFFNVNNHSLNGTLDIILRAKDSHQNLSYDRQKLIFLPILSKYDSSEFEMTRIWIEKSADKLQNAYSDWLPRQVKTNEFLMTTAIPYVPYYSFGEQLPIINGDLGPGIGPSYENLAALIANHLANANLLIYDRDIYISKINVAKHSVYDGQNIIRDNTLSNDNPNAMINNKFFDSTSAETISPRPKQEVLNNGSKRKHIRIFISYSHKDKDNGLFLKFKDEFDTFIDDLKLDYEIDLFFDGDIPIGEFWHEYLINKIDSCDILFCLISRDFLRSNYISEYELGRSIDAVVKKTKVLFGIYLRYYKIESNPILKRIQLFKPDGIDLGLMGAKEISFAGIEKDIAVRDRYMSSLIEELKIVMEKL